MHRRWNILGLQNRVDPALLNNEDLGNFLIYGQNRFHDRNQQEVYQVGGLRNRLKASSFNGSNEDMVRSMAMSHFAGRTSVAEDNLDGCNTL